MSTATDILRARANEALAALVDCADNAPWDADYCRRAIVENEALAELLDVLDRISLLTVVDEHDEDISIELLDARNRLERAIAGEADHG